ncbi:MAG: rane protein [Ramlibacter sp.]|nr:rane protein [Ramlibacter sp.]
MSELIVVAFKGEDRAENALARLLTLDPDLVVDLEDAVVAVRDRDGKVRIKQTVDLMAAGTAKGVGWGGLLGMLVGLLLLSPLAGLAAGMALGAGAGVLSGALADYGIEDDFIKEMVRTFEPGSSALFILARHMDFGKVLSELEPLGGKVVKTALTEAQQTRLTKAIQDLHDLDVAP